MATCSRLLDVGICGISFLSLVSFGHLTTEILSLMTHVFFYHRCDEDEGLCCHDFIDIVSINE